MHFGGSELALKSSGLLFWEEIYDVQLLIQPDLSVLTQS